MIASHSRLSLTAVKVGLRDLRDAGFIEWTSGRGRGHANEYRALIPKRGTTRPVSSGNMGTERPLSRPSGTDKRGTR